MPNKKQWYLVCYKSSVWQWNIDGFISLILPLIISDLSMSVRIMHCFGRALIQLVPCREKESKNQTKSITWIQEQSRVYD